MLGLSSSGFQFGQLFWDHFQNLVASNCVILQDYLSDTPRIARYGVFGVST